MPEEAKQAAQPLSLKANMLWNSAGSLIYFASQWLLTVVAVRLSYNFQAAGTLSLAMAIYNTVSPIAVYRMYTYQVSDITHENTVGEYFTFRIITCSIALLVCTIYSTLTCPTTSVLPVILFTIYKIACLLIDILHASDQVNGRMDYVGISFMLEGIGSLLVFTTTFKLTNSLETAMIGMTILVVLVGILYDYPRAKQFESINLGISQEKLTRLLLYCLPLMLAAVACSAAASIPRQFLAFAEGENLLGAYASVAAPAAIIQMGASYIYNPLLSRFAEFYLKRDMKSFRNLLFKTASGIVAFGVGAGGLLTLIGPWLLELLFGVEIAEYSYLLPPVIVCTFVTAFLWLCNDLLISIRNVRGVVAGCFIALILALVFSIPLINAFSANGISFAITLAYLAGLGIMVTVLYRLTKNPG